MAEETARVGYANPPRHSQFKKGQSGNPAGRPKSKVSSLLAEILNEEFNYNGVVRSRLDWILTNLAREAPVDPVYMRILLSELRHRDIFEKPSPEIAEVEADADEETGEAQEDAANEEELSGEATNGAGESGASGEENA